MSRRKVNYKEGDWMALPLVKHGGWGLGLIARCKAPLIVGYFFGPRRAEPPTMADTRGLRPADALLIAQVGDLGLLDKEWRTIGSQPNWHRSDWPLPKFWREQGKEPYLCTYDEDNPGRCIRDELTTWDNIVGLPRNLAYGYVALSITLDMAIAKQEARTAA